MALPPTPSGYDNWNQYITDNAPALMESEGLTFQEAKASLKLLLVAMPVRQAKGTPSYRIYNEFSTWAERTVAPTQGRPWRITPPPPEGSFIVTEASEPITTEAGAGLITE